jgi:hypothetical protein
MKQLVHAAAMVSAAFPLIVLILIPTAVAFQPLPVTKKNVAVFPVVSTPPTNNCNNNHNNKNHHGPLRSQYVPLDEGSSSSSGDDAAAKSASLNNSNNNNNNNNKQAVSLSSLPGPLRNDNDIESLLEYIIPTLSPILAFATYEYVAQAFSMLVELCSDNNWSAVDGGQLQAKIIAPAINGIVVPAIALLYATLTSTTITTLRQRQVDIRRSINLEAGELRNLGHIVYLYPEGQVRDICRTLLLQYVRRLLLECRPTVSDASDAIDPRKGMDTELNGFLIQIHEGYDSIPRHLADQSFSAVARLREYRMIRITALQSTYPALHWVTIGSLAFAACTSFLIETNQDILYFLQAFQLKLLWATLIGTFTSCFTVFYDLGSPFAGQYKITASIDQLHNIKVALKAAMIKAENEIIAAGDEMTMMITTTTNGNSTSVDDSVAEEDPLVAAETIAAEAAILPIVVKEEDSHFYPPRVDSADSTTA